MGGDGVGSVHGRQGWGVKGWGVCCGVCQCVTVCGVVWRCVAVCGGVCVGWEVRCRV